MVDRERTRRRGGRAAFNWRPHLHLIAVVLAVIISLAALAVFLATRQTDLAEGTPVPPIEPSASPTVVSTATPLPDEAAYPAGSLPALLRLAPDWLDRDTGLPVQATYADLARWLEATGVDPESADASALQTALAPLELPEVLETRALGEQWREVYGFDLRQVDQVLAVGQAPNLVLIMPGRYDADALYETWVASGYQAVEVEETTVWSLVPGERIDLSAPASRPALGMLNTVVLLEDGTLVATARQSHMAATLRVINGDDDALYDRDALRRAVVTPAIAGTPSAVIASGQLLRAPATGQGTGPILGASPVAGGTPVASVGAMPPVDLVVFALAGDGSVVMTMIYDDPPDAAARLPAALRARAGQDAGWSARYRLDAVVARGEGSMVEVRFTAANRTAGLDVVDQRELGPFTWSVGS